MILEYRCVKEGSVKDIWRLLSLLDSLKYRQYGEFDLSLASGLDLQRIHCLKDYHLISNQLDSYYPKGLLEKI